MERNIKIDIKKLKPLLNHAHNACRLTYDGLGAICLCCGAKSKQVMKIKHKKGCAYIEYYEAREYLEGLL